MPNRYKRDTLTWTAMANSQTTLTYIYKRNNKRWSRLHTRISQTQSFVPFILQSFPTPQLPLFFCSSFSLCRFAVSDD